MENVLVICCEQPLLRSKLPPSQLLPDLLPTIQPCLPHISPATIKSFLQSVHRVIAAPTNFTLSVAVLFFPYVKEIAIDESAFDGRDRHRNPKTDPGAYIRDYCPNEQQNWDQKRKDYYGNDSLEYGYNIPPGTWVVAIVEDWFAQKCVEKGCRRARLAKWRNSKKCVVEIPNKPRESEKEGKYRVDVDMARLQVAVDRKLSEIGRENDWFLRDLRGKIGNFGGKPLANHEKPHILCPFPPPPPSPPSIPDPELTQIADNYSSIQSLLNSISSSLGL